MPAGRSHHEPGATTPRPGRTARRRRLRRQVGALAAVGAVALCVPAATGRYTVRWGDTLSGIAAREDVSVRALAAANGIDDPMRVPSGTPLVVPPRRPSGAGVGRG